MTDSRSNTGRVLLKPRSAIWTNDPRYSLTDAQLDELLLFFEASEQRDIQGLRQTVQWQFQIFLSMAEQDEFLERDGRLEKTAKPSTIVEREAQELTRHAND